MKMRAIDNSAAAGMAAGVLALEALPGIYVVCRSVSLAWQVWLTGLLSALMLLAAIQIVAGIRVGWKIGWLSAFVALIWLGAGAVQHPMLLTIDSFGIGILEALVVLSLATVRLTRRADPDRQRTTRGM